MLDFGYCLNSSFISMSGDFASGEARQGEQSLAPALKRLLVYIKKNLN